MDQDSGTSSDFIEIVVSNDKNTKNERSSNINTVTLRHTWTINGFSFCSETVGENLCSPAFSARKHQFDSGEPVWNMILFPKGVSENWKEYVSLYVISANPTKCTPKDKQLTCMLGVVNAQGKFINLSPDLFELTSQATHGLPNFMDRNILFNKESEFLSNDKLTIFCEITIKENVENISKALSTPESKPSLEVLKANKFIENEVYFESLSATQINVCKFSRVWSINNFSSLCRKSGKILIFHVFSTGTNKWKHQSEWHLELKSNVEDPANGQYVSLYLKLVKSNNPLIAAKCKVGFLNAKREHFNVKNLVLLKKENLCTCTQFIKKDTLLNEKNEILLDDKLVIFFEIAITLGSEYISATLPTRPHDFGFLKDLCDVTFSVGQKQFLAHKFILETQIPVFKEKFENKKNTDNMIKLSDMDEEDLCEFLRYVYTGKINTLEKFAPRFLRIAEEYAMVDLKSMCEKALLDSLSPENAADIFILGDSSKATELKNCAKKFIITHAEDVANTPGFDKMFQTHPHLGKEVFCALSNLSIT